jgi:hypothetical protein
MGPVCQEDLKNISITPFEDMNIFLCNLAKLLPGG